MITLFEDKKYSEIIGRKFIVALFMCSKATMFWYIKSEANISDIRAYLERGDNLEKGYRKALGMIKVCVEVL